MNILTSSLALSLIRYGVSRAFNTSPKSWHLFKVCLTCFLTYLFLHHFIMRLHLVWLLLLSLGSLSSRSMFTSDFSVVSGSCLKSWVVFSLTFFSVFQR